MAVDHSHHFSPNQKVANKCHSLSHLSDTTDMRTGKGIIYKSSVGAGGGGGVVGWGWSHSGTFLKKTQYKPILRNLILNEIGVDQNFKKWNKASAFKLGGFATSIEAYDGSSKTKFGYIWTCRCEDLGQGISWQYIFLFFFIIWQIWLPLGSKISTWELGRWAIYIDEVLGINLLNPKTKICHL